MSAAWRWLNARSRRRELTAAIREAYAVHGYERAAALEDERDGLPHLRWVDRGFWLRVEAMGE